MAAITVEQQKAFIRAIFSVLKSDMLDCHPAGDMTLRKEMELAVLDSLDDLQDPLGVPDIFAKMSHALRREMLAAGFAIAPDLSSGSTSLN